PVEQAGDEPVMLAEQAPGVGGAGGADRRAVAALALERAPDIDVFLLDDGFSHLRVRRDIEILTFPAADPFAGGLLLPGGRLREPLGMARLADAAVLTGLEARAEPPADFEPTLRRHGFAGRVFTSALRSELVGGPSPKRPLLVTGVARPERVARTAAAAGLECVDHLRFPDHHGYPPRSLRAIESACARHRCDAVVVTSKDAVKLRGLLPAGAPALLELRVEARLDPEFLPWLAGRLGL
ncbi:MAG: tetraacyldisaccharide 4'-kinase, partial [Acidobacteriota bacterium]|nr:tetraacyldisaccharide 4'-kinase [Acidobacteriota bacterium]